MPLNAEDQEQPYFIPTSENVSQILAELRTDETVRGLAVDVQQLLEVMPAVDRSLTNLQTFTSRTPMTTTIQLPETCPYREGQDFSIYQLHNRYHWQGEGRYEQICSEDGSTTLEACVSDVIFWLHRANGYDMQTAHALVQMLGLPELDQPELDLILEDPIFEEA